MAPELAVVIVNYRVEHHLRACLASLEASRGIDGLDVWIVDDASGDGGARAVAAEHPKVRLIVSPENVGYTRANNLALREVLAADPAPRYTLLLNPDTVLGPDTLRRMIDLMESLPRVGVAGPRLHLADGTIDWACRRGFPTPLASLYHMVGLGRMFPRSRRFGRYRLTFVDERTVADVDSVVGAFMLIRTEVLRAVGLLDESFFMYGEDLDLAFRIKRAGWRVVYNGLVDVLHYKRASSRQSPRADVEFYRSMLVFFRKHYAPVTALPVRLIVEGAVAVLLARARCKQLRAVA
jgi:N-acetylglucosaminyl-diphospho-decaprenol L-rhamnosyltransferase